MFLLAMTHQFQFGKANEVEQISPLALVSANPSKPPLRLGWKNSSGLPKNRPSLAQKAAMGYSFPGDQIGHEKKGGRAELALV